MPKKKKKKTNKKIFDRFIVFMSAALLVFLIIWIITDNKKDSSKETDVTAPKSVLDFNAITVSEALELIKSKDLTFIYIGYEGCIPCDNFVPTLAETADYYDMTVYYIDRKSIDMKSKDWKKFTDKLTKEVSLSIKQTGKSKETTKTIGAFLYDEGYTPTFVVLKDNKLVDGNIGAMNSAKLQIFLTKAGFKEK